MLSKLDCINAITAWNLTRKKFSLIQKVMHPSQVFKFTPKNGEWIKTHSEYPFFHAYLGVYKNELILIAVPLNAKGQEINLTNYTYASYGKLEQQVTLLESSIIEKRRSAVLSEDMEVLQLNKQFLSAPEGYPKITEEHTIDELLNWKYNGTSWLFAEASEFNGDRIVQAFNIPTADVIQDENTHTVYGFFGLKTSLVYNRLIPVLIFVHHFEDDRAGSVLKTIGNQLDFSKPCPPFCELKYTFKLL